MPEVCEAIPGKVHYFVDPKTRIGKERAQGIGEELFTLKDLTDIQIVKEVEANPKKYPFLHDSLLWHNQSAADLYRARQVAYLRRHIQRFVEPEEGQPVMVRAFIRVTPEQAGMRSDLAQETDSTARIAVTYEDILEDSDRLVPVVLQDALRDMVAFRKKYLVYKELFCRVAPTMGNLFDSIEQVVKEAGEKESGSD